MTIDIEPLRKQLGRKIEDEDVVTQAPLKAMIATFDRQEKAPEEGEPIAPGWHLCFLHSYARPAQLGRDGAAFTGGVLPEIPMPRRMYAGSTFTFDGEIRVGDKLKREIEFSDIQLRQGSTGTLIVTTQTRRLFTPRGLALTEAASTVFREDPKPGEKSAHAGARGRAGRRAVAAHHHARPGDAVPLLGDHLQPAPHPLRPHLLHGDRGLSRPGRARAVRAAMHLRPAARFDAGPEDQDARRARPRAAVRHRAVRRDRPADGGRQRAPSCGR